jgi:copper chaperone
MKSPDGRRRVCLIDMGCEPAQERPQQLHYTPYGYIIRSVANGTTGAAGGTQRAERSESMADTTMTRTILTVPDISCAHCEQTVTRALEPLAGVRAVAVDIPAKTVQVTYDPDRITVEQMTAALAAEDYPVAAVAAE